MFASADQTEQIHGSEIEFYITGIQNDHISNKCMWIQIDWSGYKELWFVVDSGGRCSQKGHIAGQYYTETDP